MNRVLSFIVLFLTAVQMNAQDDLEYRMEIGAGIGVVSYEGDFNGNILKDMQPIGSLIARRVINPYMAIRLSANYGKLKGSSADVRTYYPQYQEKSYEFDRNLVDVSLTYEYNFWPYGTGHDYRGAKPLTPFIFGGVGATYVKGNDDHAFTANIPLGVGLKYKVAERVNVGLEWGIHFSFSDKLDGVEDPYGIQSSGLFKNTDCYSAFQVSLTYNFSPKCRTCNKDY